MYEIKVDNSKKAMSVRLYGNSSGEEIKKFNSEFQSKCKGISTNNYSLIIDAVEMKALKQEDQPLVVESVKLYKLAGFKQYYSVLSSSAVTNMQTKKMVMALGLNMKYVKSISEALSVL